MAVKRWLDGYEDAGIMYGRDRGIMRLCARIISRIIGDLLHNWANPA